MCVCVLEGVLGKLLIYTLLWTRNTAIINNKFQHHAWYCILDRVFICKKSVDLYFIDFYQIWAWLRSDPSKYHVWDIHFA